nr:MAG TPA: hypothetical protein [Caudoviricetes sp.]
MERLNWKIFWRIEVCCETRYARKIYLPALGVDFCTDI